MMIPALTFHPPRLNRPVAFGHRQRETLSHPSAPQPEGEDALVIRPKTISPAALAQAILKAPENEAFSAFMTLPANPNLVQWNALGSKIAYLAEPQAHKLFRFMMQANLSLNDDQRAYYKGLVQRSAKHHGSTLHEQRECYHEFKALTGRSNPESNPAMRSQVRHMLCCPQDQAQKYANGQHHPTTLIISGFKGLHEDDSTALLYILHQNLHHVAPHIIRNT